MCDRCAERFGGADPARADARGAGVPRGVGRRLPPRDARARRRARRREHHLPAPVDRGRARDLGLEHGRVAPGPHDLCHRSVLEALERGRRPVRAALREAAARDLRPARRRRAALAAELRAHRRRDSRSRVGDRGRARGGHRRSVDVGLRGVRQHDSARHARRAPRLGGSERGADRPVAEADRGRARPRSRSPHDAPARRAAERRGRDGRRRSRRGRRRARDCDRRDRGAACERRATRLRRRRARPAGSPRSMRPSAGRRSARGRAKSWQSWRARPRTPRTIAWPALPSCARSASASTTWSSA